MFLLYNLSLRAPIWPIGVGGPRVRPVRAHSSYATLLVRGRALVLNGLMLFTDTYKMRDRNAQSRLSEVVSSFGKILQHLFAVLFVNKS
jgi:hypothetical protein